MERDYLLAGGTVGERFGRNCADDVPIKEPPLGNGGWEFE
jgi:hypothetical protein